MSSSNYYEDWLALWDKSVQEYRRARKVIQWEEMNWVKTRQDAKSALAVAPETGFKTNGGITMLAEIPVGWMTGRHSHGEEAIYIIKGKGCTFINGERYDWEEGSCLRMPFGASHQHFNTGDAPVLYYSALVPHLENYIGVARFVQEAECGEYSRLPEAKGPVKDHDAGGRRIVLHKQDAAVGHHGESKHHPKDAFHESYAHEMGTVQHAKIQRMMGNSPDFIGDEVEITDIFYDKPRWQSEKHAHMEAILHILQGEGYSIVDGEKIPWKPGTTFHIQGPQTVHQHFNTSDVECQQLRTHFGIRKVYQPIVKDKFPYIYYEAGRPLERLRERD
ncbi:MAG TPA: cupin domain-containing protein [Nitrososphaerales archaeon]|nr:cupin domain-containing protein [Nitrososphaerales archaeon]